MAKISREAVSKIAKLCRINLSEKAEEKMLKDLSEVLTYVEQLEEINVEGVKACNHVLPHMVNVEREDEIGQVLDREEFLNNSPSHISGMVRVPPVIKNK